MKSSKTVRRNPPKADAQHLVKMAEYHLRDGDLQKAKSYVERAYPLIDKAYPTKWAADLLSMTASIRAQLRRFGVEVVRTTPKEGWKTFEQGRVNPTKRKNPTVRKGLSLKAYHAAIERLITDGKYANAAVKPGVSAYMKLPSQDVVLVKVRRVYGPEKPRDYLEGVQRRAIVSYGGQEYDWPTMDLVVAPGAKVNPKRRNPDLTGHYDVKSADDVMNYDEPYLLTTVGRVKSYIRPYTGPGAGRPEARGFHDVRFDDDRIKPKSMSNYAIAHAITAANIDRAVQAARRDAMSKHKVQHAMLTENPKRRKNPAAKAKPQSRTARTVKRVQEALTAGVILHFSTMKGNGTAGPYHEAVDSKNNFAIFRDYKSNSQRDYYPSAFSAADHLVAFIGEGNAIEALKGAAKKVGLRYVNLDTPIPWATGRRRF